VSSGDLLEMTLALSGVEAGEEASRLDLEMSV
jgi:hypothetical protein